MSTVIHYNLYVNTERKEAFKYRIKQKIFTPYVCPSTGVEWPEVDLNNLPEGNIPCCNTGFYVYYEEEK